MTRILKDERGSEGEWGICEIRNPKSEIFRGGAEIPENRLHELDMKRFREELGNVNYRLEFD